MTRLTPDQVKPFLLHPDVAVRTVAGRYFADSASPDPAVMPLVVQAYETYGVSDAFAPAFSPRTLVQTADTVAWLIANAGRLSGWKRNAFARTVLDADLALLKDREAEVRAALAYHDRFPALFARRLELSTFTPDQLWQKLAAVCDPPDGDPEQWDDAFAELELIVEALGRQGNRHAARALELLSRPLDTPEPPERDIWLLGAAVRLAGELRLSAAAEAIVGHMHRDWEVVDVEGERALTRIGSDDAIRAVAAAYRPGHADPDSGFKIYATGPLGHIHTDLALATCVRLFDAETDSARRDFLATAVVNHLSPDGTRHVLAAIEAGTVGFEGEAHVAPVCTMLGIESAVADRIRRDDAARALRNKQLEAEWEADQRVMRSNAVAPPARASVFDRPPPPPAAILGKTAAAGRNDKCPCGSGKKYKKCCMGKARRV